MLEDAHILSESSDDEEATAIKELGRDLRHQLNVFTDGLEDKRSYIEDAVRLYAMLDKVSGGKCGGECIRFDERKILKTREDWTYKARRGRW